MTDPCLSYRDIRDYRACRAAQPREDREAAAARCAVKRAQRRALPPAAVDLVTLADRLEREADTQDNRAMWRTRADAAAVMRDAAATVRRVIDGLTQPD